MRLPLKRSPLAPLLLAPTPASAQGKLNVDHDDRGSRVDRARKSAATASSVESIARGYQDPHFVEAKPSFILKLQKADVLVVVGRELEIGWLPPLIQQSRNAKIQPGAQGYLDASLQAHDSRDADRDRLRAPWATSIRWATRTTGSIRRTASGSPRRSPTSCRSCGPTTARTSSSSLADFTTPARCGREAMAGDDGAVQGTKMVTYHRSFPNFAERFGLEIVGYVEPRPGIPPTPQHTLDLMNEMKRQNVKLVLVEP